MSDVEVRHRKLKGDSDPFDQQHKEDCINIARKYISGWSQVEPKDIQLKPVTGGLTNVLTRVMIPEDLAKKIGCYRPSSDKALW